MEVNSNPTGETSGVLTSTQSSQEGVNMSGMQSDTAGPWQNTNTTNTTTTNNTDTTVADNTDETIADETAMFNATLDNIIASGPSTVNDYSVTDDDSKKKKDEDYSITAEEVRNSLENQAKNNAEMYAKGKSDEPETFSSKFYEEENQFEGASDSTNKAFERTTAAIHIGPGSGNRAYDRITANGGTMKSVIDYLETLPDDVDAKAKELNELGKDYYYAASGSIRSGLDIFNKTGDVIGKGTQERVAAALVAAENGDYETASDLLDPSKVKAGEELMSALWTNNPAHKTLATLLVTELAGTAVSGGAKYIPQALEKVVKGAGEGNKIAQKLVQIFSKSKPLTEAAERSGSNLLRNGLGVLGGAGAAVGAAVVSKFDEKNKKLEKILEEPKEVVGNSLARPIPQEEAAKGVVEKFDEKNKKVPDAEDKEETRKVVQDYLSNIEAKKGVEEMSFAQSKKLPGEILRNAYSMTNTEMPEYVKQIADKMDNIRKSELTVEEREAAYKNLYGEYDVYQILKDLGIPVVSSTLKAIDAWRSGDWNLANEKSGKEFAKVTKKLQDSWNEGGFFNRIKSTIDAAKGYKEALQNTKMYTALKATQKAVGELLISALGIPAGSIAPFMMVLGKNTVSNMLKTVSNGEVSLDGITNQEFLDSFTSNDEEGDKFEAPEFSKKWDENAVPENVRGYNAGLEEEEKARKELPSDAFVKIIYRKEPWIRKFRV